MEEWRIKWLRMAMLRLHTLLPDGFTIRQLSNASFTLRGLTKRFTEGAESLSWVAQVGSKPSKSGKSIETIYKVTPSGRAALIRAVSPLYADLRAGTVDAPACYFRSIEAAEESLVYYLGQVERGENTMETLVRDHLSAKGDVRHDLKICFSDYEGLKDIDAAAADQLRKRIWSVIQRTNDGMKAENPKWKGNLLDYFRGEA
ncbi:hypothetical protein [Rhizobium sp. BK176]|uniref:hypothetical protein n=1 Tax=Rhizobium sp. BK176 TaxID=2587071 RepID=UPI00216A25C0|nr:hypothetical protein [Rhizobium sp. BK176]MCS4089164.1 hypothetical protein [Rhizobium sp. BK176]